MFKGIGEETYEWSIEQDVTVLVNIDNSGAFDYGEDEIILTIFVPFTSEVS